MNIKENDKIAGIISFHQKLTDEITRNHNSVIEKRVNEFINSFETDEEKNKALTFLFCAFCLSTICKPNSERNTHNTLNDSEIPNS